MYTYRRYVRSLFSTFLSGIGDEAYKGGMMSAKSYMCARVQLMARFHRLVVPLLLTSLLGACNRQNYLSPSSASTSTTPADYTTTSKTGNIVQGLTFADVVSQVAPG